MKSMYSDIRVFSVFILLLLAACTHRGQHPEVPDINLQQDAWSVIGPGGGGGVFIPTISPFDKDLIFAKGDMTGAFVSYNGGKQWYMFNLMTVVTDFEFDPSDSYTVYAASRGYLYDEDRGSGLSMLYRSENKGKTWRVIYPDIDRIKHLEMIQSMQTIPSKLLGSGTPDGSIDVIRVDPADNRRIFLGLSPLRPYIGRLPVDAIKTSTLVGSFDRGKTWRLLAEFPGSKVLGIFPGSSPELKDRLIVVTDEVGVTVNMETAHTTRLHIPVTGIVTTKSGSDLRNAFIYIIAKVRRNENGGFSGGVYRSLDGCENWTRVNGELLKEVPEDRLPHFLAIGVCRQHPEVAYLSVYTPASGPDKSSLVRYEIYKTENSGDSWKTVYSANSIEVLSHNFEGSWLNRDYDPGWGGYALTLGVAPSDPDICYATDFGRAYRTTNGGVTWKQVCSKNHPDGSVSSTGLDLTCCYGIDFDPFIRDHLVVSYIDVGLFHSYDGGKTWKHLVEGIPRRWVNTCYDLSFDPEVKGRVWSAWANKHSLPRRSQFGDGKFAGYVGGVAVSDDGGRTWRKSNGGLPEHAICTDLLLDPDSPVDTRRMYVSIFNRGVFKSVDGGKNWVEASAGLGNNSYAWQLRRAGNKLFLLCVRGWRGEEIVDGALYKSEDGAMNWQPVPLPDGVNAPSDLLVDPEDSPHMYLSCWPRHIDGKDVHGGVYMTEDGGKNWIQVFDERIRVFAAAFHPEDKRTLFINTFQNAAYRSDDAGKSWNRIKGYRFKWGHRPVPDPRNPDKLFLTTYGGSVFYGDSRGIPQEFGTIENIPESWW